VDLGVHDAPAELEQHPDGLAAAQCAQLAGALAQLVAHEPRRAVRQVGDRLGHDLGRRRRTGDRRRVVGAGQAPAAGEQAAQRGRVGHAQHQCQHVHALVVQLGPQGLGHHHVEGLRGRIADHVASTRESRARGHQHDAASPACRHRAGEVMADLHGHDAVPLHHRQGYLHRVGEERLVVRVRAGAVHDHPDLEPRSRLDDLRHGVGFGEIDRHDPSLDPRVGADCRGHLVERALAAGDQHHVEPALGHSPGVRRAHPVRRAGHERPRPVTASKGSVRHGHDLIVRSFGTGAPSGVSAGALPTLAIDASKAREP